MHSCASGFLLRTCVSAGLLIALQPWLSGDELTLQTGSNFVALNAANALTATAQASQAQAFDRRYAGNGYFYLAAHGGSYVAVNASTGVLSAIAANTLAAEQFQAVAGPGTSYQLQARTTGNYVAVDAGSNLLKANATSSAATLFQIAATPDATPYVMADLDNPRQQITGFGASIAFYNGWLTAHPNKEEIYRLLFDRDEGLGASILRLQNNYDHSCCNGAVFDPDSFEEVAKANQYRGSPITIMISSWTPPAALKASGQESCQGGNDPGCTLAKKNGAYDYAGFAQYWADSIAAYRANGVSPTYISLQNEPDWTPDYVGCRFNPNEAAWNGASYAGYAEALNATHQALQGLSDPPAIVGPEVVGIGYGVPQSFVSAMNTAEIGAVAHHLYHGGDASSPDSFNADMFSAAAAAAGKPLFQTEYYLVSPATAFDYAWLIHNSMAVEETSAYLYWSFFWAVPDTVELITIDNPWSEPSTWTYPPNGYKVNDTYYAVEHFSRLVQPGMRRVMALTGTEDLRVTAYMDDRRLVYVLLNTSATTQCSPVIAVNGPYTTPATVYRSTFSGTTERFAWQAQPCRRGHPVPIQVVLPPQSVATVLLGAVTSPRTPAAVR